MSIERIERDSGVVWRVRWRESGRNRSKVLGRKRDTEAVDAELRRRTVRLQPESEHGRRGAAFPPAVP